ncbi:hypothetical protein H8N00_23270 [Streptomyces sp. AC563]|uniref:hypothetical protein n=1 Tax=Streptomyces buecherae TaxID=2763006 RepID=UPI00164D017D|nr:hypothetical protein [Streptomyces buecherae]MBC3991750.1 hypothetical protein [Streptomyces buecherae]
MSSIAKMSERHIATIVWVAVLGGVTSVLVGDRLWRAVAGLGPGAGYAFGAFCGSGILCCWVLASAALRQRRWVRGTGAAALWCVAFLALACLPPGRTGRLTGALALPGDQRMWVEEHPGVWWAIGIGFALGALAVWRTAPRRRPPTAPGLAAGEAGEAGGAGEAKGAVEEQGAGDVAGPGAAP